MTLGTLIKQCRIKSDLTQLELAEKLGYKTAQFISLMELDKSKIPPKTIGKLVTIINLPKDRVVKIILNSYKENLESDIIKGLLE